MINKNTLLSDAMIYVNKLLLPLEWLYYHQYNHSLEVMERCVYLWKKENVSKNELEILALAWLFHDTGFVIQYDDNEYIWAKIAKNYLTSILYPKKNIEIIEKLILATKPHYSNPKNILEKIIKDADLDNLWRNDFFDKKEKLRHEIETIKKIKIKDPEWDHASLVLLNEHKYYTKSQKEERESKKIENRKILEEMMKELQE